jgi:hypothetical protein
MRVQEAQVETLISAGTAQVTVMQEEVVHY